MRMGNGAHIDAGDQTFDWEICHTNADITWRAAVLKVFGAYCNALRRHFVMFCVFSFVNVVCHMNADITWRAAMLKVFGT
jgi:hypothetical protein